MRLLLLRLGVDAFFDSVYGMVVAVDDAFAAIGRVAKWTSWLLD
jgi:hypothetical protein